MKKEEKITRLQQVLHPSIGVLMCDLLHSFIKRNYDGTAELCFCTPLIKIKNGRNAQRTFGNVRA